MRLAGLSLLRFCVRTAFTAQGRAGEHLRPDVPAIGAQWALPARPSPVAR